MSCKLTFFCFVLCFQHNLCCWRGRPAWPAPRLSPNSVPLQDVTCGNSHTDLPTSLPQIRPYTVGGQRHAETSTAGLRRTPPRTAPVLPLYDKIHSSFVIHTNCRAQIRPYTIGGERHPDTSTAGLRRASQASIVACTCLSVTSAPLLARRTFDVVILDEAGQVCYFDCYTVRSCRLYIFVRVLFW